MDKVDTYDVCYILFVRLVPNQITVVVQFTRSQPKKRPLVKSKMLTWQRLLGFSQTPLKHDGETIGINLRGGCCISLINFDLWMNAEENMAALQNSVIYGFVSNVYSVTFGSLILVEFTGDAIHCKLQPLLEHLYSALFIFCLVWWQL